MNKNYKLYLKCILSNENYAFVSNLDNNVKNVNLLMTIKSLYYLTFHFRFSSLFYSTQLVDIFSYEIPQTSVLNIESKKSNSSVVVYNFHILNTQNRFFFFYKGWFIFFTPRGCFTLTSKCALNCRVVFCS